MKSLRTALNKITIKLKEFEFHGLCCHMNETSSNVNWNTAKLSMEYYHSVNELNLFQIEIDKSLFSKFYKQYAQRYLFFDLLFKKFISFPKKIMSDKVTEAKAVLFLFNWKWNHVFSNCYRIFRRWKTIICWKQLEVKMLIGFQFGWCDKLAATYQNIRCWYLFQSKLHEFY